MKKVFSVLAITLAMVSMLSVTAFAHGGHGHVKRTKSQPQHAVCTVKDCTETGSHQHDGNWYCSQNGNTGDTAVCTVDGCSELGLHQHDGVDYYCQNHGAGVGHGRGHHR